MHGATAQGSRPIQQGSDDEDASQTPSPKTLGLDTADVKISPVSKALLTKEDLEKHFDLGLKEAARRLGVCNTTLKRACRYRTKDNLAHPFPRLNSKRYWQV